MLNVQRLFALLQEITLHLLRQESTAGIISSDDRLMREVMSAVAALCVAMREQVRSLAADVFLTLLHQP